MASLPPSRSPSRSPSRFLVTVTTTTLAALSIACGRSRQAYAAADIQHHASNTAGVPPTRTWKNQDKFAPTHNAAPGADMAVVALDGDASASLHTMRWGLVPSSTKQDPDHWRMFNARSETVDSLAVFSRLLTHKRCAVPLSGWFEWKPDEFKEVKKKQPYYTTSTSDEPVWAAALYDVCGSLETFTLITRDASARSRGSTTASPCCWGRTTFTRGSTARRRWRRSARHRPTPRRSRRRRSRRIR